MGMSWLPMALVTLCLQPVPAAERLATAEGAIEAIRDLTGTLKYASALQEGEGALKKHPGSLELRMEVTGLWRAMLQPDRALQCLLEGGQVPGFTPNTAYWKAVSSAQKALGDDAAALTSITRALALDENNQALQVEARDLRLWVNMKTGETPDFEEGSQEDMVQRFLSIAAADGIGDALEALASPTLLEALDGGHLNDASDSDLMLVLKRIAQEHLWNVNLSCVGGQVMTTVDPVPGQLDVRIACVQVHGSETQLALEAIATGGNPERRLRPDLRAVYEGLDPEAQREFLTRMSQERNTKLLPLKVWVHRAESGQWQIKDLEIQTRRFAPLKFSQLARQLKTFSHEIRRQKAEALAATSPQPEEPRREDPAFIKALRNWVGPALFLVILTLGGIALFRRRPSFHSKRRP